MSKAFTKEDEGSAPAVVAPRALELPPGTRNYLTPGGAARLRAELAALDPGAAHRAQFLAAALEGAEIVDPNEGDHDRVRFGATVRVRDEEEREHTYHIVGVPEAEPTAGKVSWLSPLARALLGAVVGDFVTVRTPGGAHELEVAAIAYDVSD
jgi:transcription elongation factor GreB